MDASRKGDDRGSETTNRTILAALLVASTFVAAGLAASQLTGQLDDRTLRDATIEGAHVADSRVEDSTITKATVQDSDLEDVDIRSATVEDSTMDDSSVRDTTVRRSTMTDTTLRGVTIIDSTIKGGRVEKALMEGGSLQGVTVVDSTLDDVDRSGGSYCRVYLKDEDRYLNSGCPGGDDDDDDDTPTTPTGRTIVLRDGGAGPNYDRTANRGQFFMDAAPGTITRLCIYAAGAGTTATIAGKENPDNSFPEFRERFEIDSNTPRWYCNAMNERFTGDTLFVYRTDGTASIGWERTSDGGSYASFDNGRTWRNEPGIDRGYSVTIET